MHTATVSLWHAQQFCHNCDWMCRPVDRADHAHLQEAEAQPSLEPAAEQAVSAPSPQGGTPNPSEAASPAAQDQPPSQQAASSEDPVVEEEAAPATAVVSPESHSGKSPPGLAPLASTHDKHPGKPSSPAQTKGDAPTPGKKGQKHSGRPSKASLTAGSSGVEGTAEPTRPTTKGRKHPGRKSGEAAIPPASTSGGAPPAAKRKEQAQRQPKTPSEQPLEQQKSPGSSGQPRAKAEVVSGGSKPIPEGVASPKGACSRSPAVSSTSRSSRDSLCVKRRRVLVIARCFPFEKGGSAIGRSHHRQKPRSGLRHQ